MKDEKMFIGKPFRLSELKETGVVFLLEAGISEFETDAGMDGVGYFTFLDDGFHHQIVTLLLLAKYPDYILVSARGKSLPLAIDMVIKLNTHLQFSPLTVVQPDTDPEDALKLHKLFFETLP